MGANFSYSSNLSGICTKFQAGKHRTSKYKIHATFRPYQNINCCIAQATMIYTSLLELETGYNNFFKIGFPNLFKIIIRLSSCE